MVPIYDGNSYLTRWAQVNPLTHGRFSDPYFKVLWEGGKTKFLDFFFTGASAAQRFARSSIFRYGCLKIILSKRQKGRGGRGVQRPPPWFKGLKIFNWRDGRVSMRKPEIPAEANFLPGWRFGSDRLDPNLRIVEGISECDTHVWGSVSYLIWSLQIESSRNLYIFFKRVLS